MNGRNKPYELTHSIIYLLFTMTTKTHSNKINQPLSKIEIGNYGSKQNILESDKNSLVSGGSPSTS